MQKNRLLTIEELFGITNIPNSNANINPNLANNHFSTPSLWYKTGKFLDKYGIWFFIGGVIITSVAVSEKIKRKASKSLSTGTNNHSNLEGSLEFKKTNKNNPIIVKKNEMATNNHVEKKITQSRPTIIQDYNIL